LPSHQTSNNDGRQSNSDSQRAGLAEHWARGDAIGLDLTDTVQRFYRILFFIEILCFIDFLNSVKNFDMHAT
jgi:hypothetical protein